MKNMPYGRRDDVPDFNEIKWFEEKWTIACNCQCESDTHVNTHINHAPFDYYNRCSLVR